MSDFERIDLVKANYARWNFVAFVTLNEFIYLAYGCEPCLAGPHGLRYQNSYDPAFKKFYTDIKRLAEDCLPFNSNEETEVRNSFSSEPKYEAVFLLNWSKRYEFDCCKNYQPEFSEKRKITKLVNEMRGEEFTSLASFAKLLAMFNKGVGDQVYFEGLLIGAGKAGKLKKLTDEELEKLAAEDIDYQNINYEIVVLTKWAQKKKFTLPDEVIPNEDIDYIHPKRLRSFQLIVLTMAVIKYHYTPYTENTATGTNSGSISADVEKLAACLRSKQPNKSSEDLSFSLKEEIVKYILDGAVKKFLE